MENEKITAWVTKYALTHNILRVNGEVCHEINSNILLYGKSGLAKGKDWHRTAEAALYRADEMRAAKIESLRKSIARLEKLNFYCQPRNDEETNGIR